MTSNNEKWNKSVNRITIINNALAALNDPKIKNKEECTLLPVFIAYLNKFLTDDYSDFLDDNLKIGEILRSMLKFNLESPTGAIKITFTSDDFDVAKTADSRRLRYLIHVIADSLEMVSKSVGSDDLVKCRRVTYLELYGRDNSCDCGENGGYYCGHKVDHDPPTAEWSGLCEICKKSIADHRIKKKNVKKEPIDPLDSCYDVYEDMSEYDGRCVYFFECPNSTDRKVTLAITPKRLKNSKRKYRIKTADKVLVGDIGISVKLEEDKLI